MSSTERKNKIKILSDAGYRYSFNREVYVNRDQKMPSGLIL